MSLHNFYNTKACGEISVPCLLGSKISILIAGKSSQKILDTIKYKVLVETNQTVVSSHYRVDMTTSPVHHQTLDSIQIVYY